MKWIFSILTLVSVVVFLCLVSISKGGNKKKRNKIKNAPALFISALLSMIFLFFAVNCEITIPINNTQQQYEEETNALVGDFSLEKIPSYSGSPYCVVNENNPYFQDKDFTTKSYEKYCELDSFGRCGVAIANIGIDIMPTEERGSISSVKPSGWHSVEYDGSSLYNRCHLIGFQLAGENANELNLVTGTRYMNVVGMLPFENMIADYVKETNNHVLYRVTPVFENTNLVVTGVLMEAKSLEDGGEGILFNVFCYNVQPGITIDYSTGESSKNQDSDNTNNAQKITYILNTNGKKIHLPSCSALENTSEKNKQEYYGSLEEIVAQGYTPCKLCNP